MENCLKIYNFLESNRDGLILRLKTFVNSNKGQQKVHDLITRSRDKREWIIEEVDGIFVEGSREVRKITPTGFSFSLVGKLKF